MLNFFLYYMWIKSMKKYKGKQKIRNKFGKTIFFKYILYILYSIEKKAKFIYT